MLLAGPLTAEDWPEWRGKGRAGVWRETGLVRRFPEGGPPVAWRAPLGGGYTGPAVADGRVFVTDYAAGRERAVALDEQTGRLLWEQSWPADYRGIDYAGGPRATPTVDAGLVYVLGAAGDLLCLRAASGAVVWRANFRRGLGAETPPWGFACAPVIDGDRLIAVAGGRPDAKVVAFDKRTGRILWRALSGESSEPGYSQPILVGSGPARRLVVWHAGGLAVLQPDTGKLLWEHPYRITFSTPIATPVVAGEFVLVTAFFQGARLLRLASGELLWRGRSDSEVRSETLHSALTTPVIDGEYIYGVCAFGELRCLRLATGERVWQSQELLRERARYATAFVVRNGDRYVFHTDRGELVLGRLSPAGFTEISRARVIQPTSKPGSRRELGAVNWVHPAFANGHAVLRNDEEIVRVSLRQQDGRQ